MYKKLMEPEIAVFRYRTALENEQEKSTVIHGNFHVKHQVDSEMCRNALKDLRGFLIRGGASDGPGCRLILKINPRFGRRKRDHKICIGKGTVTITGKTEWGCAAGIWHLERLLRLKKDTVLPFGTIHGRSKLDPALVFPAFKSKNYDELSWPEAWGPEYLARIARSGATGVNLILYLDLFVKSDIFPEMNNPDAEKNLEILKKIVRRLKKYSLELYITWYLKFYPSNHPLFQRLPETRGSFFLEKNTSCLLCTSAEVVGKYYEEQFQSIWREVPGLGGAFLIVGCEGFLHCYTANMIPEEVNSNCPGCNRLDPENNTAALINRIAASVKKVSPESKIIVWTYNIHCWTKDNGVKLIGQLSKDCSVMVNFDTGDNIKIGNSSGVVFDYSISTVGPGKDFRVQSEAVKKAGLELLAKCENGCALEFCGIKCLPAVSRWAEKFRRVVKSGASGAILNWDFIGYTGSITADIGNWNAWDDGIRNLPQAFAESYFGKQFSEHYVSAWKQFSNAIEHHPFSIGTAGYFRGPFYLGFAQPLILHLDELKQFPETFSRDNNISMIVADLSWCRPYGVKNCLSALKKEEKLWKKGMEILQSCGDHSRQGLIHLADSGMVLSMIRTAINTVEFYWVKDCLWRKPVNLNRMKQAVRMLGMIAERERENTLEGLSFLKKDPDFTFSYTYHYGFNIDMIEEKLKHTENTINYTIPLLYYGFAFSDHRKQEMYKYGESFLPPYESFEIYREALRF